MTEILVVGGTGKSGSRVSARLAEQGATVRVGTRTTGAVAHKGGPTHFEWYDVDTFKPALNGADAVYMVPPGFTVDYVPAVESFLAAAKSAGVQRVVFLSARGAQLGEHIPMRAAEEKLAASGLDYTILRPAWFNQNFSEYFLTDFVKTQNMVPVPAGSGRTPFIDLDDLAAVAVAALTEQGHAGITYDITGPQALSFGDTAAILSGILERDIAYVALSPAEWKAAAIGLGVPAAYADLVNELFGLVRNGGEDHVSADVTRILGRPPRSFQEWARSVRATWL